MKNYTTILRMVYLRKDKDENLVLIVKFPFSTLDVDLVKSITGRRYNATNPKDKYWTVPPTKESFQKLHEAGFGFDDACKAYLNQAKENKKVVTEMQFADLPAKLYPFQEEGIRQVQAWNGRILIADDMGLGKTVQALVWLRQNPQAFPAVIVVPASLKLNWKREAEKWLKTPEIQVISGTKPHPISGRLVIINYDILPAWVEQLVKWAPKTIVLDEAHYMKNDTAVRTKAAKKLAKTCSHVIAMSGTAVVNRPIEIYNAIQLINPQLMPSRWKFAHRYCGAKHNGFGWDFNGSSNIEELHEFLKKYIMIRRRKTDVLTELPDKTYNYIPIEISNRATYQRAETEFIDYIREVTNEGLDKVEHKMNAELQQFGQKFDMVIDTMGLSLSERHAIVETRVGKVAAAETLVKMEMLKQLAVEGKMEEVFDWIDDFIDSGKKLIVFAVHKKIIDALMQRYGKKAVKVDGSVSQEARQQAVDAFQNLAKIQLFVGNIKAAGVGLTLTAASDVAFVELPWTPGDLEQAEDRAHRIGQKNNVQIHFLLAADTIEEQIAQLLEQKKKVVAAVLDGKVSASTGIFSELMRKYR